MNFHKWIKKYANNVQNTSWDWGRSLLRESTVEHIKRLQDLPCNAFTGNAMLIEAKAPGKKRLQMLQRLFGQGLSFTMSQVAQVDFFKEKVSVSDIVQLRVCDGAVPRFGQVLWHVCIDDPARPGESMLKSACKMLSVQSVELRVFKLIALDDVQFVNTSDILCALTCAGNAPGTITALKPLHCCVYPDI